MTDAPADGTPIPLVEAAAERLARVAAAEAEADAAFTELTRAAALPEGITRNSRLGDALLLVERLRSALPGPELPPMLPRPGQSDADWRAAVAEARTAHNAYAVSFQSAVRERGREALGVPGGGILAWELEPGIHPPAPEDIRIDVDAIRLTRSFGEASGAADGDVPGGAAGDIVDAVDAGACPAAWTTSIRIQRPDLGVGGPAAAGAAPAIVELHGGAFWMGDGDCLRALGDPSARYLAGRLGAVVVTVDYHLTPEHGYPTPVLDAIAAIDWVRANAATLGVDAGRILLAGTSSGGNVATAAAIADGEREGVPPLAGVVLTAPALDLTDFGTFYSSTPERRTARAALLDAYTGAVDAGAPTVSPARHPVPATFPPAVVVTSAFDEVAAGSAQWAAGLADAGIPVRHGVFEMTHTLGHPHDEADMREYLAAGMEWLLAGAR
ncbi:alpha/beta hydrolase fold domain-containing protein [Agromyces archimandritae]|uniref:Alpha/beta hydrolase fold domain-containing protein n=1 Tax=Agromyces archimandritae TaxID=2781962 RepID=A0A975IPH4_9MICO|nr:alpha/beta hydrolase fold domain-containing protein [Agromyces archimandritae]QTX05632.1 alpha/beta hydrolase fold domain-containing protein [Agromyces archimandritae]